MLSTLFDKMLLSDRSVAVLNLKTTSLSQRQFKLLLQITTATKQTIAKSWKTATLCVLVIKTRSRKLWFMWKLRLSFLTELLNMKPFGPHGWRTFSLTILMSLSYSHKSHHHPRYAPPSGSPIWSDHPWGSTLSLLPLLLSLSTPSLFLPGTPFYPDSLLQGR